MKTILVTGGAGFVGSHLCERLLSEGNTVISLDNYFTGSKENHIDGVEYREGHTKDIETLVPENPDIIYHLGEYSRVRHSLNEPAVVWDLNMDGTFAVLEFWRNRGGKLVYAGSSTKFVKEREDGVVGRDLAPYTWAKAANTELVKNYARWYDLEYVTVYFYNVYGPREMANEYGTFVGICKDKFLKNEKISINAPGTQSRCFTHVNDTVDGIVLAAKKGNGDGYGIGAKDEYTLIDVAELFGLEYDIQPATRSTRSVHEVDSTKLEVLGWSPNRDLKTYIEEITKEHA